MMKISFTSSDERNKIVLFIVSLAYSFISRLLLTIFIQQFARTTIDFLSFATTLNCLFLFLLNENKLI